ncbi:MAG: response regulator transcription factor [Armatimonadota bacterium]|nr:response regulator transcription factor [Armatimonadota bacterium]
MNIVSEYSPAEAGPAGRHLRVLLLSRTALVRIALRQLLGQDNGVAVVGEAGSLPEALTAAARERPDIVLVDMHNATTTLDRLHEIQEVAPSARTIILSDDPEGGDLFEAARAGVWGYLPPDVTSSELLRAARGVAQGRVVVVAAMPRQEFARLGGLRREPKTPPPLSPTESRVVRMMSEGHTDGEIASRLGVSVPTVKTHVRAILKKTSTKNRTAAITAAFRSGLLT